MSESNERPPASVTPQLETTGQAAIRTWSSQEILGTANEARITHGTEVYRLLLTRNQKLILIK
jgi:hemin uptake protein HemP